MKATIAALALVALSGCATITSGTTQTITVQTDTPCTATRGDQTATVTPEWPRLTVGKGNDPITLVCGTKTATLDPSVSAAGWTSIVWLDFGIVDSLTGALWAYDDTVDMRVAP